MEDHELSASVVEGEATELRTKLMNRRLFAVATGATALAAAGGASAQYDLMLGKGVQNDWRHCNNCFCLYYGQELYLAGACAFGGHHVPQGLRFQVYFDNAQQQPTPGRDSQFNWRFCDKCWVMFYDGGPSPFTGVCPVKDAAAGNRHRPHGLMFGLAHNNAANPGQNGWRFCSKCWALFYGTAPPQDSTGFCAAGGKHTAASNSFDFDIPFTNNPGEWIDDIPKPPPVGAYNPYYVAPGAGGTPSFSASVSGAIVTFHGSGFAPGRSVRVQSVVNNNITNPNQAVLTANSSGAISGSFSCSRGSTLALSATDGRANSNDATGILFSNTQRLVCQ